MIGDVIGRPGREAVERELPGLRDVHRVDFVTANGENVAGGMGLTTSTAESLYRSGVDVITSGNHIWDKKEILPALDKDERILRPHNYGTDAIRGRHVAGSPQRPSHRRGPGHRPRPSRGARPTDRRGRLMARGRRAPLVGRVVPPEPSVVDLHTHTSRSDGLLAPRDLVADAVAAGIRTLAITDHDTLAGYRDVAAADGVPAPAGLALIAGVEINAVAGGLDLPDGELHVVGLGVDPDDDAFEAALAGQRGGRRRRFERMAARLRAAGLAVDAQLADLDAGREAGGHERTGQGGAAKRV